MTALAPGGLGASDLDCSASKWNIVQQKSVMETSVPDDMNFHNLVLRNSKYNRER